MMRVLALLFLMPVSSSMEFRASPTVSNTLAYLHANLQVEFAFCAYGTENRNIVSIERITLPVILAATDSMVLYNYETCPTKKNLLGLGHSHPGDAVCDFSSVDVRILVTTPFKYGFLACKNQLKVYIKQEVRMNLLRQGLLATVLGAQ